MPQNKDLKRLVRQRMDETGERYTVARAAIVGPPDLDENPDRRCRRLAGLVQLLADKPRRIDAIRELMGAITATEMRSLGPLPEDVLDALAADLMDRLASMAATDPNAKVRREVHYSLACRRGEVPRRTPRPR
jgi:hypothetical protein